MSSWETDPTVSRGVPVRAAQYVRMSTEHQKYSTENQADIIQAYAERRGFEIVETYADQGKSGLKIEGREALMTMNDRAAGVDMADLLLDPSVSAHLKAVVLTWVGRDVVDAAADARMLADLFERRADEALSWVR